MLPLQAQVIFESSFEDWEGDLPTDWYGSKSNLPQSGVSQVTEDVFDGDFAVRLTKATSGHQRFTTQIVSVEADQDYEVRFMVRGEGQIRIGLFDGRATGSGYAPYNPQGFVSITGNTWQEVTLTVTAAMDTTHAEFILSVQNTVAPEHLVVDMVTITATTVEPPPVTSIQEIQFSDLPNGASPLEGSLVSTGGIVTGTASNGFWIQNGGGPWSGIFVFSTQFAPMRGDSVTMSATVVEFPGGQPEAQTQLSNVEDFVVASSGNPIVVTTGTTAEVNGEPYEGVLIEVLGALCTNPDAGFGEFTVNDGSGAINVDDRLFAYTAGLNQAYNITGLIDYAFGEFKILPRDIADIEVVTSVQDIAATGFEAYPNPASDVLFIRMSSEGRTEAMLHDASGRVVREAVMNASLGTLSVEGLAAGLYTLRLLNSAGVHDMRVMITR